VERNVLYYGDNLRVFRQHVAARDGVDACGYSSWKAYRAVTG
jgi:hypothetical protein